MNVLEAAYTGMKQGVDSLNLVKKAENAGYAGVAKPDGLSFRFYGCSDCRKNTAIKFVHIIENKALLACHCGWRKKVKI